MRISVYITSYNQKAYLIEAIESVLAQTLPPHQLIIVDDASQDGSQEVIKDYANRYNELITPVYHAQNLGIAHTRNDALKAVTGDYVTYVDGDDRFLPTKLEVEAKTMLSSAGINLVYSNYDVIDNKGQYIFTWSRGKLPEGNIFCQVFGRQFPKNRLFRSELVHYKSWYEIGFYDTELSVFEDYDMRIRLTHHMHASYINQPLSEHRSLGTGLSKLNGQIYLDAFEYIRNKNSPLLSSLIAIQQQQVMCQLDHWQAALIRQIGRQSLRGRQGIAASRAQAYLYYQKSLKYSRTIDAAFWLEFLLGPRNYQRLKHIYLKLRHSSF